MMIKASITVEDSGSIIFKSFAPEDREIKKTSKYRVAHSDDKTEFLISAADSGSLRTVMNSITKMLTVIEKMKRLK